MGEDLAARAEGIGALAEPLRRELYLYVAGQAEPVSRDQAAAAVGTARSTARFHLDRLVADGLLEVEFRRLTGRSGPGAGRPAKLYRRVPGEIAVSLPERDYHLAGDVLARAVEDSAVSGDPVLDCVRRAAAECGTAIAEQAGGTGLSAVLADQGYEPREEGGRVVLANCPFHRLAREHTELVCTMNLAMLDALVDGLGARDVRPRLDPAPGRCCVTLDPVPPRG
jgi:predicted ArsR family transcriptional regulator